MNDLKLTSTAEQLAEKAENLKAFSGLKLLHVKRQVAHILSQIGRDGIFDEYTKHDISHIDFMLESLDWIIPAKTKEQMTPSDWLMITLAIYFHDLGMLVTRDEFKDRKKSSFPAFKQSIMDGIYGLDFKDKVLGLGQEEKQDRFIYQELVRKTHAERIKYWILDEVNPHFPNELIVVTEIKKLIVHVDTLFRRDLAQICESHHQSDLDDLDKYRPNQQYGPTKEEKVNLHYSALLLRTADLLHITSDRTPSIEFSLINPNDPISQEEWAKQKAVKTIRPQLKKDKDGMLNDTIPQNTFEVIAFFEEEKGFFGLISYINYANKQLKENFKHNEFSNRKFGLTFEYPWRDIDDSGIETKDFEKRQFEFILDQTKILDLLVGHTLYNDSSVVLRELTQNAIDAAKLKKHEFDQEGSSSSYTPKINVSWAEKERELSFMDNGTGMTLEIIQNHLLKVGSSRYQDESFKKKYPDFSPISRFGIGLLTCFLIADDIDITTKSSDSDKAILLKIKKVHGKYLLKYLKLDKLPPEIKEHGTIIRLYVRADVQLQDIESEIRKWILIPNCDLTLDVEGKKAKIGYQSPSELLKAYLSEKGYDLDNKTFTVKEVSRGGITLAFALRYVEHWKEWDFLEYREVSKPGNVPIGTCVEGIRVDFNTPGFNGRNLYAIVNTSGKNAPKTNVARSNIEITPEREALLYAVYQLYLEHIANELKNLRSVGFSITWASNEANWLLQSFTRNSRSSGREVKVEDSASFERALAREKLILIEKDETRDLVSLDNLKELDHFWSIDCASYSSADSLIKEVKSSNTSALALLKTIFGGEDSNTAHIDYLFCSQQHNGIMDKVIRENFQVDAIIIVPEQRRLDLRWSLRREKIWEEINMREEEFSRINSTSKCYVQLVDIEIDESVSQIAINSANALFILKNSELNTYLVKLIDQLSEKTQEDQIALSTIVTLLKDFFYYRGRDKLKIEEYIESMFQRNNIRGVEKILWDRVDKQDLMNTILKTDFIKYDTTIWYRREMY